MATAPHQDPSVYPRPHLSHYSALQLTRLNYHPPTPQVLRPLVNGQQPQVELTIAQKKTSALDTDAIAKLFPHTFGQPVYEISPGTAFEPGTPLKVGVVLSGGQAAGGHNCIIGLYDFLKARNNASKLYGFLGGPIGIIKGEFMELTEDVLAHYRNQGGFDVIGTGRDKIETNAQLQSSQKTCEKLNLDGLVVIGGDDSNTNAAVLAEYFKAQSVKTCVIGIPKTIDGDLKNEYVEVSFGFDTACKIYANLIGNIATDSLSAKKYYHFIRLMGRSASHITLECALQCHPNIALIGGNYDPQHRFLACIIPYSSLTSLSPEEVAAKKQTLEQVTNEICDIIAHRAALGKNYGIVLVPEGLIEFVPEVSTLISELNELLATTTDAEIVKTKLSSASRALFDSFPKSIREELMLDRDPHGNVQVSKIETEKLLIHLVEAELKRRRTARTYKGKFAALNHFFGYEGRCGLPSNFDANYCHALGKTAAALLEHRLTGYMAVARNLTSAPKFWKVGGIPLTMNMNVERRKGKDKPVIRKALVELNGPAFQLFIQMRAKWAENDEYMNPGPIQFFGIAAEATNHTLELEHGHRRLNAPRPSL